MAIASKRVEVKPIEAGVEPARYVLIGTNETLPVLEAQVRLLEGAEVVACLVADALPDDLEGLHASLGPFQAVVSLPSAMTRTVGEVREALARAGVQERFVPPLQELLRRDPPYIAGLAGPRQATDGWAGPRLDVASLIGRPRRPIDLEALRRVVGGRNVLVTGAGGSIGSELCRIAASLDPARLILMERAENALFEIDRTIRTRFPEVDCVSVLHDVVDEEGTLRHLSLLEPDIVFHAAAHKHVPLMEDHPRLAVMNNLLGTRSIAEASCAVGVERFVMISTDKAVHPRSVMGATKRLAELCVQWMGREVNGAHPSIVRFGNVLGSACSVLSIWSAQLAEGGPLTVTDPRMTRYFMTIDEAAALVMQSLVIESDSQWGGDVFVLDMGEPVSIVELARRFARAHGFDAHLPNEPCGQAPVEIAVTGMRPGEKIHEQLAHAEEHLQQTSAPGIRRWQGPVPGCDVPAMLEELAGLRPDAPRPTVLEAIGRHLPGFLSTNRREAA